MSSNFYKVVFVGILVCLIIIAFKPSSNQNYPTINPDNINQGEFIVQLSPNRIAVINNDNYSGMWGTVLVFSYDPLKKEFKYESTMNYNDYFKYPQKYGLVHK